ncbi:response regulator transcription factor [Frigoribacterium sp. PhB116]|uniref:response regulator n=1 Tax=Frigoribacterium sp. PhB116 TaxID=2485174 RepID=UPI0010DBDFDE|nr:response regulator transcription factor [Frigoribacterium sp. PhB116]TDT66216.1 LuxR family two component transcriptional regulator [Frigoribacterium sp. PhB116]
MSVRTLVVDDHPIMRQGLTAMLTATPDFEVVGQASDGVEAVELATELRPDLVLMDLRMPRLDGVAATEAVLRDVPTARVVVLTTYESDDAILGAVEAGASGYLLKAAPEEELLAGLRSVVAGQVALAPSMAALLVGRARRTASQADASGSEGAGGAAADGSSGSTPTPLSPRETQVLVLVAEGCSNREIGLRLFVGEATVKTHLQHVFEKLGVGDRTRAVTLAMERGWLPSTRA